MFTTHIAHHNTWEPFPIDVITFAGGEPHAKLPAETTINGDSFLIDARIDSFNTLGNVLVVNNLLRRNGAAHIHLFCPYLPGARQDRDAPLTAKVYADIINAAGFDTVTCIDPHSDVMPALLDRLTIIGAADLFPADQYPSPADAVLISPDAGATKRTEQIAIRHGYDIVYAHKHRDTHTGDMTGFGCGPIPDGKTAIVVDDICDGGGTFLGLADVTGLDRDRMALWTSHAMYSKGVAPIADRYRIIGTTDSFPRNGYDRMPTVHPDCPQAVNDAEVHTAAPTVAVMVRLADHPAVTARLHHLAGGLR